MKKIISILSLLVISTIFIVGCSSSKNSDRIYLSNCPDNMDGMGKKYFVNNLEKGNYEVEFTAKEYEYGILKKEHKLSKSVIEHNGKNDILKVGVIDGNEADSSYLKTIINDTESKGYDLDFLEEGYNTGIAISILNQDKYFSLDNEVAIALYSIGGEDRDTECLNIDEEFEIGSNNLKDLVVYVKLQSNE